MRATSIGHAGILIEANGVSILCDPWFVPAFFGSWFPFPRNDQLSADLLERIERADFLYVSHLHGDHHDTDHHPRSRGHDYDNSDGFADSVSVTFADGDRNGFTDTLSSN